MTYLQRVGILLLGGAAVAFVGASWCVAEVIETFPTAADPFPGSAYDHWNFVQNNGAAKVVATGSDGLLEMRRTGTTTTTYGWATQTSSDLFGAATFIERFPDGFTVSVDIGGRTVSPATYATSGISIGNIVAMYWPGYDGFQWRVAPGGGSADSTVQIGWTPTISTTAPIQQMVVHVEPDGVDYRLCVTITEGLNSFSTAKTFTATALGSLSSVGLYYRNAGTTGGDGLFDNFAVVPEPGTLLLLTAGLLTAVLTRRRGSR